jgi:hypothetical protein
MISPGSIVMTSAVGRLTVFVRHENVVRLLEFLGYSQEE